MEGELVFIEELSKRLQTGGPPRGAIEIDRPRIEEFLSRYQPRHLTRSEQLEILHGFHDVLDREINRSEALENTFGDLIARIDQANTLHELKTLHCDLTVLAIRDFQETGSVRNLQQKCTRFRQEITCRLIKLVETEMVAEAYGPPPSAYAWISMGADGRREQTILTDQDSLLVYRDVPRSRRSFQGEAQKRLLRRDIREKPLDESQIDLVDSYFEIFSRKVINSLDGIGIKRCMGGVMPTSEKWRGSLEDWMDRLKQKIKYGSGTITVLDIIILMDARSIAGDASLGGRFIGGMRSLLERSPSILAEVAKSAVLMPVAIGFLRRFRTERSGPHKGRFDVKLRGWAPLVLTLRILAVKYGVRETNTFERIRALQELDLLSPNIGGELEEAYRVLFDSHIRNQIESIRLRRGHENFVDPTILSGDEQAQLKYSLLKVELLQKLAHNVFFPGGIGL